MGTTSVSATDDGVNRRVRADDIRWRLDPLPRLETIPTDALDLVDVSPETLIEYVVDLREDAAALRATLHAALLALSDLNKELTRSRQTVARLREDRVLNKPDCVSRAA